MHKLILDACKKAGIKDVSKGYPAEAKERNAGTLRKFLYELDILMQEQDDERFKEVRRVQDLFNDASKKLNNLSEDLRKGERKHARRIRRIRRRRRAPAVDPLARMASGLEVAPLPDE